MIIDARARHLIRIGVHEALDQGAAHIPYALSAGICQAWQKELEAGPFTPVHEQGGLVDQQFDSYTLRPESWPTFSLTDGIQTELTGVIQNTGIDTCAGWGPNEIAVQRYLPTHEGITPHRDYERDRIIVAVWSLGAAARFRLHLGYDPEQVLQGWMLRPGSLVLLRAPGLTGRDDRPYHSIRPPQYGTRISVGMRYNQST